MKKTIKDLMPITLNRTTTFTLATHYGAWHIIDVAIDEGDHVYTLLEHDELGDETACVVVRLPLDPVFWTKASRRDNRYHLSADCYICETWDTLEEALDEEDIIEGDLVAFGIREIENL